MERLHECVSCNIHVDYFVELDSAGDQVRLCPECARNYIQKLEQQNAALLAACEALIAWDDMGSLVGSLYHSGHDHESFAKVLEQLKSAIDAAKK